MASIKGSLVNIEAMNMMVGNGRE